MRYFVTGLLCLSMLVTADLYANKTTDDYASDKAIVDSAQSALNFAGHHFNPNSSLPGYTPHPDAEHDYHGITGGDGDIDKKARQHLSRDKAGGTVYKDFTTRPKVTINKQSPDFADSTLVKNDSYNITHGISDQYIDCQHHATCKTVMSDVHCIKTNTINVHCTKVPVVTVTTDPFLAPIPKPCTHIVVMPTGTTPPKSGTQIGAFRLFAWSHWINRTFYAVVGASRDNACYVPGSFRIEHDRDQHGTSAISAMAGASYYFYGQAWYYNNHGYADLFVQVNGKTVARVQAHSNQAHNHTAWVAHADERIVLNGYNHGFDDSDYNAAYSAYWASVPKKQTHQVAHVAWHEDCGDEHA